MMAKNDGAKKDAEVAAYYYYFEHRSDADVAGEPIKVVTPEKLSRVVSVRFSPAEAEAVQRRADTAGLTLSGYLRQAALDAAPATDERIVRELAALRETVARIESRLGA